MPTPKTIIDMATQWSRLCLERGIERPESATVEDVNRRVGPPAPDGWSAYNVQVAPEMDATVAAQVTRVVEA